MVEHGQQNTVSQLEKVVRALSRASIDDEHFLRGFAGLLSRLGKHWRDAGGPQSDSPSVLNPVHAKAGLSPPVRSEGSSLTPNIEALLASTVPGTDAFGLPQAPNFAAMGDLTWNFDPTFQMPAADHEQDMLFESIWGQGAEDASGSASNLYATLLGDALAFPEGLDGS
jgi:hypothetical protein